MDKESVPGIFPDPDPNPGDPKRPDPNLQHWSVELEKDNRACNLTSMSEDKALF